MLRNIFIINFDKFDEVCKFNQNDEPDFVNFLNSLNGIFKSYDLKFLK